MASDYFIISLKPEPYSSIGSTRCFAQLKQLVELIEWEKK